MDTATDMTSYRLWYTYILPFHLSAPSTTPCSCFAPCVEYRRMVSHTTDQTPPAGRPRSGPERSRNQDSNLCAFSRHICQCYRINTIRGCKQTFYMLKA